MKFYAPIPRAVTGINIHDLIRRLFRSSVEANTQRIDLITTTQLRVSMVDTGESPHDAIAEGDTTVHILWQMHESTASITVGGETSSIAPGDTATVPSGDEWRLSSHQLAVLIVRRIRSVALPYPPHHGSETFAGHNRRTTYDVPGLVRWKLTEPLTLPARKQDSVIISLYNDIALQHRSEVELMRQGNLRVIRAGEGEITIVPNGLTYILVISAD